MSLHKQYELNIFNDPATAGNKENPQFIPRATLENVVAVLLKRFAPEGITTITMEEIMDAQNVEARHDFEHDTMEFRLRPMR